MFTIIIIIILVLAFYQGYRQGLAMQMVRLLGYILSFVLANYYYEDLSKFIEILVPFPALQPDSNLSIYNEAMSFYLDDAFYKVLTFILILIISYLVTRILSVFLSRIRYYSFLDHANGLLGGLINLAMTYVGVFLFLFTLSLLPIEWVQQQFVDNPLLYWIVSQTPFLSDFAIESWLIANPFV